MHLNFEGKTTENPTSADIARAVPRGRVPEEWTIELVGDDGVSIEADPGSEAGTFKVAYVEGRRIYDADRLLSASELEQLLITFLKHDAGWRRQAGWKIWAPEPPASARRSIFLPVLVALVSIIAAAAVAVWYYQLI